MFARAERRVSWVTSSAGPCIWPACLASRSWGRLRWPCSAYGSQIWVRDCTASLYAPCLGIGDVGVGLRRATRSARPMRSSPVSERWNRATKAPSRLVCRSPLWRKAVCRSAARDGQLWVSEAEQEQEQRGMCPYVVANHCPDRQPRTMSEYIYSLLEIAMFPC